MKSEQTAEDKMSMFEGTVRQFEGVRAPKVPIKSRMTEGEWQDSR